MLVFVDCRIQKEALQALCTYGHVPLLCPPHPALESAVASHPDMLLFPTDQGILSHADYSIEGVSLIPIGAAVRSPYPHDVLLNAAVVGEWLVCRPDAVAEEILLYAKEKGIRTLPVRQGYAKCNLCIVSKRAAITEDASIAKALMDKGVDVLQVRPGYVTLPGYDYGFIGGASGCDGKHVFFNGDLFLHPDGERIAQFCKQHHKEPISLASGALTDVGSLLFADQ